MVTLKPIITSTLVTSIIETEIVAWLHQVKFVFKENWIEHLLLFSAFEKSNNKYQNKKMKTTFGRIIQILSKTKQHNVKIFTQHILKKNKA